MSKPEETLDKTTKTILKDEVESSLHPVGNGSNQATMKDKEDKKVIDNEIYPVRVPKPPMDSEEWWLMAGFWFSISGFFCFFLFLCYVFLPSHLENRNKVFGDFKVADVKYILINEQGDEGFNILNKIKMDLIEKRKTYKYKREVVEGFTDAIAMYR